DLARTYGLGRIWYLFAGSASHSAIAAAIQDLDENERELLEHANVALVGPAVMAGDFDRARGILDRALRWKVEHGSALTAASWGAEHGFHLELVAGDPAAAERWVRHGIDALAGLGEKGHCSSALCDRAEALVLLGELDEADRCLAEAATLASPADIYYEFQSRRSQA